MSAAGKTHPDFSKVKHTLCVSGSSFTYKTPYGNFSATENQIRPGEMFLFGMVKKDAANFAEAQPDILGANFEPQYFRFYDDVFNYEDTILCCNEFDIIAAYWNAARILGIIAPETYERGNSVSKKTRLASLGALATVKNTFEYDPVKMEYKIIDSQKKETASLFFLIADYVGRFMAEICENHLALFFWVDAIFAAEHEIKADICRDYGLFFKKKPVQIRVIQDMAKVYVLDAQKERREFNLSRQTKRAEASAKIAIIQAMRDAQARQ